MNFFYKMRPVLFVLAVLFLIPATEFIPSPLIRTLVQFPLCIALTILLVLQKDTYIGYYESLINRVKGKKPSPDGSTEETAPQTKGFNEIKIWEKLGLNLIAVIGIVWMWGGAISSLLLLLQKDMAREASLFVSFSVLVAGGIIYLVLFALFMWIFKARRAKDEYPFLIKPREKTLIIYVFMFLLTVVLALINKRVFSISLLQTFYGILITAVSIMLAGPPLLWLRYLIFYKTTRVRDLPGYFGNEMADRIITFCKEQKVRVPFFYVLEDDAPLQAFTYNYGPLLSWVYFSDGMRKALSGEEFESILKHEIGHVKHWDFLAIAAPAIILSSVFEFFSSGSVMVKQGGGGSGHLLAVGISIAVINFAIYALQKYLSRTREYYADEFSAEGIGNPDANSRALAKICYGLSGPRNKSLVTTDDMVEAMSWDLKNPWARMMEFLMTHPLTANRARYLALMAKSIRGSSQFSTSSDSLHRYVQFILDIIADWGFSLSLAFSVLLAISIFRPVPGMLYLIAGGVLLVSVIYKYPVLIFKFDEKNARSLMQDPKASPIRGMPVTIRGTIIGRRSPAARLCAHPVIEDKSGFMPCEYQLVNTQIVPGANSNFWMQYLNPFFLYHIFLGAFKMKEWINVEDVQIVGWFRRMGSMGNLEILKIVFPDGKVYRSFTLYVLIVWAFIVLSAGLLKMVF